jgi:hypothetical protein
LIPAAIFSRILTRRRQCANAKAHGAIAVAGFNRCAAMASGLTDHVCSAKELLERAATS